MTIETIKQAYEYRYAYLDYKDKAEVYGHIYNVDRVKYFIDTKETYIKLITD
jgi:hypothetical protein